MNKWFELILGIILLVIPVYLWGMNVIGFGESALILLKGGIIWTILLVGIIFIILGISDLKE